MQEQRCCANPNASSNSRRHNLQLYAPITFGMAASSARTSSDTSTRLNCGSMSPDSRGVSPLSASSSEMMIVPETGEEFSSSNFSFRMALARRSFEPPVGVVVDAGKETRSSGNRSCELDHTEFGTDMEWNSGIALHFLVPKSAKGTMHPATVWN
uniref:Uncharacterized protein n=1 Tax=Anopheles farauti TaxID=69004 RepID=A0A182Q0A9_9DIPT